LSVDAAVVAIVVIDDVIISAVEIISGLH